MDMFQTPFLPEPSLLEDSEEQFEAFCRKSGVCSLLSQPLELHPLFPIATSYLSLLWKSLRQSETQGLYQSEQRESSHLRLGWKNSFQEVVGKVVGVGILQVQLDGALERGEKVAV